MPGDEKELPWKWEDVQLKLAVGFLVAGIIFASAGIIAKVESDRRLAEDPDGWRENWEEFEEFYMSVLPFGVFNIIVSLAMIAKVAYSRRARWR